MTASLQKSPFALVTGNNVQIIGGFTAGEERAHAGTDWLELDVTSRLDIRNTDFHVELVFRGCSVTTTPAATSAARRLDTSGDSLVF